MTDRLATLEIAIIGNITDFLSKMSTTDKRIDTFQAKMGALGNSFSRAGASMAILGAAVAAPLALMSRSVIKTGATFEQTMRNVQSVLGETGASGQRTYETLSAFAQKMGRTTVFQATEAADALYYLASAGYSAEKQMKALKPILDLAAATQADLATSSEIVVSTLNAFRMSAGQAGRVANVFAAGISKSQLTMSRLGTSIPYVSAVARNLGISLEETVATLGVLVSSGIRAESAGAKLRTTLLMLVKPTGAARKALRELGLTVEEVDPSMHTLTEIIGKFSDAGLEAEHASDIFGKRGSEVWLTLAAQGAEAVGDLEAAITGTNAAAEMAEIQLNSVAGAFKLFISAVKGIEIIVFDAIRDDLKRLVDVARIAATAIGNFAEKHEVLIKWLTRVGLVLGGATVGILLFGGAFFILAGQILITISHMEVFTALAGTLRVILGSIALKLLVIAGLLAAVAIGFEIGHYINQWESFRTVVQQLSAAWTAMYWEVQARLGDKSAWAKAAIFWRIASGEDPSTGQPFVAGAVANVSIVDAAMREIENMFYRTGEVIKNFGDDFDKVQRAVEGFVGPPTPEGWAPPGAEGPTFVGPPAPTTADIRNREAAQRAFMERRQQYQQLLVMVTAERDAIIDLHGTRSNLLAYASEEELSHYNLLEDLIDRYHEKLSQPTAWQQMQEQMRAASDIGQAVFRTLMSAVDSLGNSIGQGLAQMFGKATSAIGKFFQNLLAQLTGAIAKALMLKLVLAAIGGGGVPSFANLLTGGMHHQMAGPDFWARFEGGRILDLFAQGMRREMPRIATETTGGLQAEVLADRPWVIEPKIIVEEATPMTKVRVYDEWFEERAEELSTLTTEAD